MTRIGFIGLGSMGYQMAARLAEKSYDLVVYNRSKDKVIKFRGNLELGLRKTPRMSVTHAM